jgi:dTDP-4-amino-4,6-dideoxygalactose transaminase
MRSLPLNKPSLCGNEIRFIQDAVRRGQLSGDGYYTQLCTRWLEKRLDVPRALLTPSGTHALELAFLLTRIEPGEEVLLPSFTFPSTANAFVLRGAIPVFGEIRADTLNLDERLLERQITRKTRVLVPVHYAGVPCEMDAIMRLARKHRLTVIEDAAQALGVEFRGRPAGTFGDLNAFSFHETKNTTCGEGGALAVVNRRYVRRAEILRQKGTDRALFFKGKVAKYSWVDVGSSYVPSDLQAAFLFAQLQHTDRIWRLRRTLHERYREALAPFQDQGKLALPFIPKHTRSSYHLFRILLENEKQRAAVQGTLRRQGIFAHFHYYPLHLSKMGKRFGYGARDFPVTERVSATLLRLPLYNSLTWGEQRRVIQALKKLL